MTAALAVGAGLLGCGGGGNVGPRIARESVEAALPKISRTFHWVGDVAPPGGTVSEAAHGLGTAIDDGLSVKATLERIAASEDPWGEAFVVATCYGLNNIAQQSEQDPSLLPASAESWAGYLDQAVAILLPTKGAAEISTHVDQFNTAADLASIQPRLAYVYVRECALRRG